MNDIDILQDWTDYNESLIWSLAKEHSKQQPKVSSITATYPHAKSIVNILKSNIDNLKEAGKIRILEYGLSSGVFTRFLSLALRDLELKIDINYTLADSISSNLEEIEDSKILADFKGLINYEFKHVDVLNGFDAQESFDLVILNYSLGTLPTTVIRANDTAAGYEEMQLKLYSNSAASENLLESLVKEERFVNYEKEAQSELEKKYFHLIDLDAPIQVPYRYYNYGALGALDKFFDLCSDSGFIIVADMPLLLNANMPFKFYSGSISHPLDNKIVSELVKEKQYCSLSATDVLLTRMLLYKKKELGLKLNKAFNEEFIESNQANRYLDIRNALDSIRSSHSIDLVKYLTEELRKSDPYSAISYIILANYHLMLEEFDLALKNYKIAKQLDFLNEYQLEPSIQSLEIKCKSESDKN